MTLRPRPLKTGINFQALPSEKPGTAGSEKRVTTWAAAYPIRPYAHVWLGEKWISFLFFQIPCAGPRCCLNFFFKRIAPEMCDDCENKLGTTVKETNTAVCPVLLQLLFSEFRFVGFLRLWRGFWRHFQQLGRNRSSTDFFHRFVIRINNDVLGPLNKTCSSF